MSDTKIHDKKELELQENQINRSRDIESSGLKSKNQESSDLTKEKAKADLNKSSSEEKVGSEKEEPEKENVNEKSEIVKTDQLKKENEYESERQNFKSTTQLNKDKEDESNKKGDDEKEDGDDEKVKDENEHDNKPENLVTVVQDPEMQLEFQWTDICITAEMTEGKLWNKKTYEKKILQNVSGSLSTGSSLAILGASGAGKTTLLNFLSRKIQNSKLKNTGTVTLNGEEIEEEDFRAIVSYVMQDDMLEPCMSPKEILMFTARLKLRDDKEAIQNRVKYLLKVLRIEKCQNTRIGDNLKRGVSGGERKRTSIAVELLSDSPIIFLDEPTTGLDSYNAYEVVNTLNDLCLSNKMVIFTIHQPASEIFDLLSKICILALGKIVYYGPTNNIYNYFRDAKVPIPEHYNPFEHFIEVTNLSIVREQYVVDAYPELKELETDQEKYARLIDRLNEKYESDYKHIPDNKHTVLTNKMKDYIQDKKVTHGFFYQLYNLILRLSLINLRNQKVLISKSMQYIAVGVILSVVFNNLRKDEIGIQDRQGLIIMCAILAVMSATTSAILVFSEDRWVFLRERAGFLYSPIAYYVSKIIGSLPVTIISINVFSVMVYFATGLNDLYAYNFWVYVGTLQLISNCATMYAYFLASFVSDPNALATANVLLSIPLLMLSGFFSSEDNFAPYLIPFKYFSLFKYCYQILIQNEFENNNPMTCSNPPDNCNPLPDLDFTESMATSFACSSAVGIFFGTVGFIILYYFVKIKN